MEDKKPKEFLFREQEGGNYNLILHQTMAVRDFGMAWGNFTAIFVDLIKNNNTPEVVAETKAAMIAHLETIWNGNSSVVEVKDED